MALAGMINRMLLSQIYTSVDTTGPTRTKSTLLCTEIYCVFPAHEKWARTAKGADRKCDAEIIFLRLTAHSVVHDCTT